MGFFKVLVPSVQFFTPQMAWAIGTKWFHNILYLTLCTGFYEIGLLDVFVA
jgi:hypothetical protein